MLSFSDFLLLLDDIWVDPTWLYAIVQLGVLAVFVVAAYRAARTSRGRLLEMLTAVFFGLLLEEGDILIFRTYRYDPHWFAFDLVPPAIALCWAMIIASAMNISDALGIDERVAPFADAVWAIILDLALDAVAIRLGLWRWNIPLDKAWFGVPFGNFYSWLWVAASFSFFTRLVRRRTAERGGRQTLWQAAVPFAAYVGLLLGILPYAMIQRLYLRQVGSDWILFAMAFAAFAVVTLRAVLATQRSPRERPDAYLLAVRYLIHLYFLWALVATGLFLQLPALLLVSVTMLLIESALVVLVARSYPERPRVLAWAESILNRRSRD